MIKFFRIIRQRLVTENKFNRYLLYAIGEILLVMIGILLALQVNNWNGKRITRTEEKESLNQIKKDLDSELRTYTYYKNYFKPKQAYLSRISEGELNDVSLDSFVININIYYDHRSYNAAYIGLKSSGKLGIIQNNDLRQKIVLFYELHSDILSSWSEWHENFVNTHIESYVLTELQIDKDYIIKNEKEIRSRLQNGNLTSIVNYQYKAFMEILNRIERNEEIVNKLMNQIDSELNKK